jgi:hypothetical protein
MSTRCGREEFQKERSVDRQIAPNTYTKCREEATGTNPRGCCSGCYSKDAGYEQCQVES